MPKRRASATPPTAAESKNRMSNSSLNMRR
jgi:hypothetical protein